MEQRSADDSQQKESETSSSSSGNNNKGAASGLGGAEGERGPAFTPAHGKVSEEALKGPRTGPVREEFEFEKKMEGRASAYDGE